MPCMAPAPSTQIDKVHDAKVEEQAKIAADVDAPQETVVEPQSTITDASEDAVDPRPLVTIQPKEDVAIDYPLSVSVVGSDDLVFSGPSDTVEVSPQVAEQITYSPSVEVAE